MRKSLFSLLLGLLVFSCGSDAAEQSAAESAATTTVDTPYETNDDRMSKVSPPPPVCVYLTEAEVLSFFDPGVQVPMPGQRAPSSYNSCQYNLESSEWSAALVVEMPEDDIKIQGIRDEVAGAKGKDALTIMEFPARIMNGGRIISVEAKKPFRVKFSALPNQGFPEAFDEDARRELIVKLAMGVMQ